MRVAVIGPTGVLGPRLMEAVAAAGHEPVPASRTTAAVVDLTSPILERQLGALDVHSVMLSAALTDVSTCERDPRLATLVNATGPARAATWCRDAGIPLLLVSTDSVFAGDRGWWIEDDPIGPRNVYATSKAQGERAVLEAGHVVVRTNFVGAGPRSLLRWLHDELTVGRTVQGYVDAVFAPIESSIVARVLVAAIDAGLRGLYHLAGTEAASKYEIACHVRDLLGSGHVEPGRLTEQRGVARPLDTSLDSRRIRTVVDVPAEDWRLGVQRSLRAMQEAS